MSKVFVGLSGGVDSAVAATLLKEQGYDVTGVFIKIWQPEFIECTWKEDRLDAMRVAVSLNIPFRELDLSEEYMQHVIEDLKREYAAGRTPNPDVLCNQHIKFGSFLQYAKENGADFIATGHHARVRTNSDKTVSLLRGADQAKDQAYFLWKLTQEELQSILLPIGEFTKDEVRQKAERAGLPVAKRPDSQGLCFVGDVDMHEFLKRMIDPVPGDVRATDGSVIGTHEGAGLYTIGQRHKFIITDAGQTQAPQYVVAIDTKMNTITVAPERMQGATTTVKISETSWTRSLPQNGTYTAEVRYHQKPQTCSFESSGAEATVRFESPQIAMPGQSLVLYSNDESLGGGIIQR